jgi:hypothetical protein
VPSYLMSVLDKLFERSSIADSYELGLLQNDIYRALKDS